LLMMMVQSTLMSITPLKFARIGKVLISCQLTDDQFQAASRLSSQCYIQLHVKLKHLMHAWGCNKLFASWRAAWISSYAPWIVLLCH
jgi:hypothetical protein